MWSWSFTFNWSIFQEAKALIKEDDDLIIAVYDYWLNKRLKIVSRVFRVLLEGYKYNRNNIVILSFSNSP